MNKSITTICLLLCVHFLKAQYAGGVASGFSNSSITQSACAGLEPDMYRGGEADGASDALLIQSACSIQAPTLYRGGEADGASVALLAQSTCTIIEPNLYRGGDADGASNSSLTQSICAAVIPNIYAGSANDGFGWNIIQPVICSPILPVQLVNFSGSCEVNMARLKWSTATERNNDFFTVERSHDGINFSIVGKVVGAGNSERLLHYQLIDPKPLASLNYYRLKQTDLDGKFEYSKVINVNCMDAEESGFMAYPNPGVNEVTIASKDRTLTPKAFSIINSNGQVMKQGVLINEVKIQTSRFPSGIYLIRLENGSSIKWIKQ